MGWAHTLRPRGAVAPTWSARVVFGLLAQCWTHPYAHVVFGLAWRVHARAPLGHTWRLGHVAGSKGNRFGVTTQD